MCTASAADDEKKYFILADDSDGLAICAHDAMPSAHLHYPHLKRQPTEQPERRMSSVPDFGLLIIKVRYRTDCMSLDA